ncbi:LOW QUALITY PROTEIN: class I histocompatibility antigen, F10 alpha chain-like [Cariama cristata]
MEPGPALGVALLLGVLVWTGSGLHSLRYFDVGVSEPSPGVPRFMEVGYVDGTPFVRYDSEMGRWNPEWTGWGAVNPQYWDREPIAKQNQEVNCVNLDRLRSRYNQSGGVAHTLQRMYGCDLLEDGSVRGIDNAYDGRDFIAFDKTMTFTADAAAVITKRKWEEDGTVAGMKHYLGNTCVEWREYVSYGQAVLERKGGGETGTLGTGPRGCVADPHRHPLPRAPHGPYGFYPRLIGISWLKDGEVRDHETVRSVVPNSDGTFYTWASIEAPEEKDKYRCRVEHASLLEPGLFAWEPESNLVTIVVVAVVVLAVIAAIAGFIIWKYKLEKKKKGYGVASSEFQWQGWLQPLPSAGVVSWLRFLATAGISRSPSSLRCPSSKPRSGDVWKIVFPSVLAVPSSSASGHSVAVAPKPAPGTCAMPAVSTGLAAHGCFSLAGSDVSDSSTAGIKA